MSDAPTLHESVVTDPAGVLLCAAFVLRGSQVLPDAAVLMIDGRIAAVGSADSLRKQHPQAAVEDAGDCILLPGLINAHTHLELTYLTPPPLPAGGFADWLRMIIQMGQADDAVIRAAVQAGIEQCIRFGVTTVADITRHVSTSRAILHAGPLMTISFGEVIALAKRRGLLEARIAAALDPSLTSDRLRLGLSPHAPYTVELAGYIRCVEAAQQADVPLATHLGETEEETVFLGEHRGPLRKLWEDLGAWDSDVPRFQGGPIRCADHVGLLQRRSLLAHVNYCDDEELQILANGNASVIYCPRTHAYFGHRPHRWREMLAAGVNVAIGTDSTASSPDLNLVDDLRLARKIAPDLPAPEIWSLATTRAATALNLPDVGQIEKNYRADLIAFPAVGPDPLEQILQQKVLPTHTWLAARRA